MKGILHCSSLLHGKVILKKKKSISTFKNKQIRFQVNINAVTRWHVTYFPRTALVMYTGMFSRHLNLEVIIAKEMKFLPWALPSWHLGDVWLPCSWAWSPCCDLVGAGWSVTIGLGTVEVKEWQNARNASGTQCFWDPHTSHSLWLEASPSEMNLCATCCITSSVGEILPSPQSRPWEARQGFRE